MAFTNTSKVSHRLVHGLFGIWGEQGKVDLIRTIAQIF